MQSKSSARIPTISGREVAIKLHISPRRLIELEVRAKLKPRPARIPALKRRYTLKEFNKLEKILKKKGDFRAVFMVVFVVLAVVSLGTITYLTKNIVDAHKKETTKVKRELPAGKKLEKGIRSLRSRKIVEARSIFESLTTCGDKDIERKASLFYLESFKDSPALYIQMLVSFIDTNPDSPDIPSVVLNIANYYFKNRSFNDAKTYYLMLKDKYPDHDNAPIAYSKLIQISVQDKKYEDAVKYAEFFAYNFKGHKLVPVALFNAATLLITHLNQHMHALELLQKIKKDYPNYNSRVIQVKISELTRDWDNDGRISAMEKDKGTSDGKDPWDRSW